MRTTLTTTNDSHTDQECLIKDRMNWVESAAKRIFDFCLAAICLIIFSPLIAICYCLIKKEDGGTVIFKQERIGLHGQPFYIYKFRSMREGAEKDGPQLYNEKAETSLTKTGKLMRDHHLDELPQLWNVLVGDMSFIGPRPERKYYIDQIMKRDARYQWLYQIRPGVTSYATLYNGYCDSIDKMLARLKYDLYYLEHRSWWLDIKILGYTFIYIISGKKF